MSLKNALEEILKYINEVQVRATIVEISLLEKMVSEYEVPEKNVRKVYDEIVEVIIESAKNIFKNLVSEFDEDTKDNARKSLKELFETEEDNVS